jgi:hypothetical protein
MPEQHPYDRIRAFARGDLGPAEAARLEADFAADPGLRAAAEEYREVHRLTGPAAETGPTSALAFEDVIADGTASGSRRRVLGWAAAAAALLAATWVVAGDLLNGPSTSEPLRLAAIRLESPLAPAAEAPAIPATLADYRPVADGRIRWLGSEDEVRAIARATGRPILLYATFPGCPMCRDIEAGPLRDAKVLGLVASFVPYRLNVAERGNAVAREYFEKGWPYLEVEAPDGFPLHPFPGPQDAAAFAANLEEGLATPRAKEPSISWEEANARAARLVRANEAEAAGRLAEALEAHAALAALPGGGAFAKAGEAGRARLEGEARTALLAARERARSDRAGAEADLAAAVRRFEGTPYGGDLGLVLARLRSSGRFPDLVEGRR